MKINVDFSELWVEVRKMTSSTAEFNVDIEPLTFDIDIQLERGSEISLDDVDFSRGGLAGVHGRQVLLYIPDHGSKFTEAVAELRARNKFHVAWCLTLEDMHAKNRFHRFVATNDVSGTFRIVGIERGRGSQSEASGELQVCKNCLDKLNYRGARQSYTVRNQIVREFKIVEFFKVYSSFFPHMPAAFQKSRNWGYTEDWADISLRFRAAAGYRCSDCNVKLSHFKRLLHTHHISGDKADNRPDNLKALCADCHRRQPYHSFVRVRHEDMQLITRLRRTQGLVPNDWNGVLLLADPAIQGALRLAQQAGKEPPELGHELVDGIGRVIAEIEAAWPRSRFGIVIDEAQIPENLPDGWNLCTVAHYLG